MILIDFVSDQCYDITTVGAFTAFAQKYKNGGLRRLLQQLRDSLGSQRRQETHNRLWDIQTVQDSLNKLYDTIIRYCDSVCLDSLQSHPDTLTASMDALADKVNMLLLLYSSQFTN